MQTEQKVIIRVKAESKVGQVVQLRPLEQAICQEIDVLRHDLKILSDRLFKIETKGDEA